MTILKMNPEEYAVSAEYLIPFMEVMKKRGFSEEQLLDGTGVRQGCWREAKSRVSATLLRRVARRAVMLTNEPWLGWELGAATPLSSHGFLGYAAMSSETLGDAIELAVKFFRIRSTLIQLESFVEGDWAVLQVNEMLSLGDLAPLLTESLFSSFHFMGMQMLPEVELFGELRFSYPEPD